MSGLFLMDLCWAGSYPAVKGLLLPGTHDGKIFLGILVSVISFRYMQHSTGSCDIKLFSEIQSHSLESFLNSVFSLRLKSFKSIKEDYTTHLASHQLPNATPFQRLHDTLHGDWYGLSGVNVSWNLFLCLLSICLTLLLWGNVMEDNFQIN